MKNRWSAVFLALVLFTVSVFVPGCGSSTSGKVAEPEEQLEDAAGSSDEDASADEAGSIDEDASTEDAGSNGEDAAEDEASVKSEPAELFFLTKDMYIEEMVEKYAVNLREPDFQGYIGDLIPEYQDVDLDGDGTADFIERFGAELAGYGYKIEFSNGGTIQTALFSSSPNEGEVIEFYDMNHDNTDEILITHYTSGTAGPSCWQTFLYAKDDQGNWQGFPIVDEEGKLYCSDLKDLILERSGVSYDEYPIRFAGIEMTEDGVALLADFGAKEGAEQTMDYEGVLLMPDYEVIKSGSTSYEDAFLFVESSKQNAEKYWPSDAANAAGASDMVSEADSSEAGSSDEGTIPEYFIYVTSPDGYANLRTGPGTEYDIICQVSAGESMEVYRETALDKNGKKWLKVAYPNPAEEPPLDENGDPEYWITGWIAESQVD